MNIRPATAADAAALADLATQLGSETSAERASARLAPLLAADDHAVLVAAEDDEVFGWVHVFLAHRVESDPFAELGGFVVTRGMRGRGVGLQLLDAAEAWAADQGVGKLRVRCRADRGQAHAFYLRRGFDPTKEQLVFDRPLAPVDGTRSGGM